MVLEMMTKKPHNLKNTHNLTSIISQIHQQEPGETVGYNRAFRQKNYQNRNHSQLVMQMVLSRKLGNKNRHVLVNNQKAQLLVMFVWI